jgi:DNA topoisomerase-1
MGKTPAHEGLEPPDKSERKRRQKKKADKKRSGKLVIVESPAKARTVARYLGKGYKVKASVGHVRDLLRSKLSVDVEDNFTPQYRVPNDKRPIVKEIKSLAAKAKEVYLATDPDREGEAIAWHLMESGEMEPERTHRVVFNEITQTAVADAFSRPRDINMDLVDAQQARRVLDRLVGYNLSPLLWRKVRGRLSAGRVQSVALRLVVDREREIDAFVPVEYWSIAAELRPDGIETPFVAKLSKIDGGELGLNLEADVLPVVKDMEKARYTVKNVKRGERMRKPSAPFITSSLQQEASRGLRFTARRTMALAQQLYEGVDVGGDGSVGLITYMRTDSTNVSAVAQKEAQEYILQKYGKEFLPKKPPVYKTKARGAQEAHEAIRPTSVMRTPSEVKKFLSRDQFRLYQLIWRRFVASQMRPAIFDTLLIEVEGETPAHHYLLRASGSAIRFQGYQILYLEARREGQDPENGENADIPANLVVNQELHLIRLIPEQHFTQPPRRFSEASLVAELEENGIGRPSTYAPILGTLQQRGYVSRENRRLIPTETGLVVNDLLSEFFSDVIDLNFTAQMEAKLDEVASGELPWTEVVGAFYEPFSSKLAHANEAMPEVKAEPEKIGRACPKCGHDLVVRWGRFGKFVSCSNFPECRHTEPWLEKIDVKCPEDGGELVERRTRRGRLFYGCENYPECEFSSWKRPIGTPCPNCTGLLVMANKNHAQCLDCENQYALEVLIPQPIAGEVA